VDYRKLIEFGNGSYILTMPRSWVKSNQLKKGDLITIDDKGHELVLEARSKPLQEEHLEISIDATGKDISRIQAEIVGAYLNCYDTITIHSKDLEKNVNAIKSILRNLSGMEIMEHTTSRIVAKNIINPLEISIENMIRRMDVLIRAIIEDAALCAMGQYSPDTINDRDADVNRLYFLGSRAVKNAMTHPKIARAMNRTPWQLHSDRLMLIRLEKIADAFKRVARLSISVTLDREAVTELQLISSQFKENFGEAMKAYYTQDKEMALSIQVGMREHLDRCNAFLNSLNGRLIASRQSPTQRAEAHTAAARITENLKSAFSQLKYLARYVLCY
jgi:phosphate uptake regulator